MPPVAHLVGTLSSVMCNVVYQKDLAILSISHFIKKCKYDIMFSMIKIIAGGKKHAAWCLEAISEYEKRMRKPFEVRWEFLEEEKLARRLSEWPFSRGRELVICCDERGENISSVEFSRKLEGAFINGREVVILIGGAYGFSPEVREKADFCWSFSKLVFPHMIARLIVAEQIYRAQEICHGGKYHHE